MTYNPKNQPGFTLIETIISIALFTAVILMTASIYSLSQRTYRSGGDENELWQNARVVLDRMTREIRQAKDLVTEIPATDDEPENPPPPELQFQDGHDLSEIKYIKYYLDNTDFKRQIIAYYFDEEPETYVRWDSTDAFENPPNELILENRIIGEYFTNLQFWGESNLINIAVDLSKGDKVVNLLTAVYGRNL